MKRTSPEQFYYKNNRLQQLRGFCYAAQFANISHAAEFMRLSQSTVSLQIKALEDDLGRALFYRTGSQIALTLDGKKLLDLALPLLEGIQALPKIFHEKTASNTRKKLTIAVNSTTKNHLLPAIIREYISAHDDTDIVLHYAEHTEAMALIQDHQVDCAFLPRREHLPFPKKFEYIPVFFCKPSLITLPSHPLAGRQNLLISEISSYPLTLPAEELRVIPNLYDVFAHAMPLHLRVSFINSETGREYIEAGLMITVSSDVWLREQDVLVATPLPHLFPNVDYGLVKKRSKTMPIKIQRLLDLAYQHAIDRRRTR